MVVSFSVIIYISALVAMLTGYGIIEFQQRYVLQVADQLLRYTDLSQEHIARQYGGINGTNLIRLYRRYHGCAPFARRRHLRQKNDEGRYRV